MAWSSPMTAVDGAFTAAQWNANVRDNLLETGPAKASTIGSYLVSTGANAIAERTASSAEVLTSHDSSSTSYNYTSLFVTVQTGTEALAFFSARVSNTTTSAATWVGITDNENTATDATSMRIDGITANNAVRMSGYRHFTGLTPGGNSFWMQRRVSAGTSTFDLLHLTVIPL